MKNKGTFVFFHTFYIQAVSLTQTHRERITTLLSLNALSNIHLYRAFILYPLGYIHNSLRVAPKVINANTYTDACKTGMHSTHNVKTKSIKIWFNIFCLKMKEFYMFRGFFPVFFNHILNFNIAEPTNNFLSLTVSTKSQTSVT